MTREELKQHCEKQVKACEMWAENRGQEPSGKVYEEHKLVLDLINELQDKSYELWKESYEVEHARNIRLEEKIKALEQQPSDDVMAIHTQGLDESIRCAMCTNSMKSDTGCDGGCRVDNDMYKKVMDTIKNHIVPPVTPTHGTCKDCKHWKDSDGVYRRGIGAESKCPINTKEVYEGNFYCKWFEKRGSENGSN